MFVETLPQSHFTHIDLKSYYISIKSHTTQLLKHIGIKNSTKPNKPISFQLKVDKNKTHQIVKPNCILSFWLSDEFDKILVRVKIEMGTIEINQTIQTLLCRFFIEPRIESQA